MCGAKEGTWRRLSFFAEKGMMDRCDGWMIAGYERGQ